MHWAPVRCSLVLLRPQMSTLTLHSPPSPSAAAIGKKTRAEEQHTNGLQHEKEQRQVAKRHRKHIHHLKKAYAKQVSKNGNPPILFDILEMLGKEQVNGIVSRGEEFDKVAPFNEVVQVTIERLSAHGDGIARTAQGDRILAIPFTLPGEVVRVYPYGVERLYFKSRLVEIVSTESSMRRDDLVQCQYFGKCGGCQYQMVPYEQQLKLKQSVVRNAFAHYSGLDAKLMPPVLPTVASPATMQYRTKLTPHFNLPYSLRHRKKNEHVDAKTLDIPIGFDGATSGRVMDIEECPIGTPTINAALPAKQADVRERITDYKNGATLLLRDSLKDLEPETLQECKSVVVTDHKATVYELVGDIKFATPAGAFFQNNRSIIPLVVDYVKQQSFLQSNQTKPQYLVDTYCGSGLFALTLAGMFHQVAGVEISASSIECAKHNATLNQIENATFLAGNAENIFGSIAYPPSQTTVVIDPPRRGCDQAFIDQLVALKPRNIVYVSCNVHTQARDVGSLLRACASFTIDSIRGFDFFPQTHHVEGVCVLHNTDYDT